MNAEALERIKALAAMPAAEFEALLEEEAAKLGITKEQLRAAVEEVRKRGAGAKTADPFQPLIFRSLMHRMPPPRRFAWEGWLPIGCVTSLYGPGGVGKSLLAQEVGTVVATNRQLFGEHVEPGHVLGFFGEDDDDELWRRQIRINDWLNLKMTDLDRLHIQGRAGLENAMAIYAPEPTEQAFTQVVREAVRDCKPVLVILDNIAHLFGGNENDRFAVTHFCNLVHGIAREGDCAVLVLGHPAKADGSEYSGSTAWNAAVRSRLLLNRVKEDEDGRLLLARVKSNYAKQESVELEWFNGVLRAADPKVMGYGDKLTAEMHLRQAAQAFLDALDKLAAQGRNVSHSIRAPNYAPTVMLAAKAVEGFTRAELVRAMELLFNENRIVANAALWQGKGRNTVYGLKRAGHSGDGPGEVAAEQDKADDGAAEAAERRLDQIQSGACRCETHSVSHTTTTHPKPAPRSYTHPHADLHAWKINGLQGTSTHAVGPTRALKRK